MASTQPVQASYTVLLKTEGDPHRLYRELNERLGGRLAKLTLTDNRRSILSAKPAPGFLKRVSRALEIRIHHCFTTAPPEILDSTAAFLDGPQPGERSRLLAILRRFFAHHRPPDLRRPQVRRRPRLHPLGQHFDLEEIRDEINAHYFEGALTSAITWGRWPPRRRRTARQRRTIHLGTYSADQDLVRVHPALDQSWVPRLVVASVVHHELLHAAMPAETVRGRRRLHPPEFRRRERLFEGFEAVEAWLAENLTRLLEVRAHR
jgi:hypothetical protein